MHTYKRTEHKWTINHAHFRFVCFTLPSVLPSSVLCPSLITLSFLFPSAPRPPFLLCFHLSTAFPHTPYSSSPMHHLFFAFATSITFTLLVSFFLLPSRFLPSAPLRSVHQPSFPSLCSFLRHPRVLSVSNSCSSLIPVSCVFNSFCSYYLHVFLQYPRIPSVSNFCSSLIPVSRVFFSHHHSPYYVCWYLFVRFFRTSLPSRFRCLLFAYPCFLCVLFLTFPLITFLKLPLCFLFSSFIASFPFRFYTLP